MKGTLLSRRALQSCNACARSPVNSVTVRSITPCLQSYGAVRLLSSSSSNSIRQNHVNARRFLSSSSLASASNTTRFTASDPDERTYHTVADQTMEDLLVYFEELTEQLGLESGADVEYSSGVLNLHIKEGMTYVLNKQPPNKQIWLSSPISGPKRYDYDVKYAAWFYQRDGTTLKELLDSELSKLTDQAVNVPLSA